MSVIKVTSTIEKVLDNSFGNGATVNNNFRSALSGENVEFKSEYCLIDSWVLNDTTGVVFSQNIATVMDASYLPEHITFIHIQCNKKVNLPTDQPEPVRFGVNWGGTDMGRMSQFQVANCDLGNILTNIIVSNVAVMADQEAVLVIVVGFNKPPAPQP